MQDFKYLDFESIDSTQKYALNNLESLGSGIAITATLQTDGVGKLNSVWNSPIGNLYASYVLLDNGLDSSTLIQCATVAAVGILPRGVQIKWLNDLILNNKKVGGIICDRLSTIKDKKYIVIGIGINLVEGPIPTSSSILRETGKFFSPRSISRGYGQALLSTLNDHSNISKKFNEYLAYKDSLIECASENMTFLGHLKGVSDSGKLCILTEKGLEYYRECKIRILTDL